MPWWPFLLLLPMLARRRAARRPRMTGGRVLYLRHVNPSDLSPRMLSVLNATAARFGDITVTSGLRSYSAQADAMAAKVERGENLLALYRDQEQILHLLDTPPTEWEQVLRSYADAGRPISRHLGGNGADLRTRDLDPQQVAALQDAVRAAGGSPFIEPDHLHIQV